MFFQLQKGDQVALVTPAAAADEKAVKIVSQLLYEAGLTPVYYQEMNESTSSPYANYYNQMPYASSDEKRFSGFQAALSGEAKAIWVLHGNQGCEKIVADMENGKIILPIGKKIIIGFSGVTNLHLYFLNKGWPCLHGPVGSVGKETFEITQCPINTQASLQKVIDILTGKTKSLTYTLLPLNEVAKQSTQIIQNTSIVGGCLNILIAHMGTKTALLGKDKIVLIEDEPQRPERIETMLMGLIRSGTFKDAKAIILGSFNDPQFDHKRFEKIKPILLNRMVALLEENQIVVPVFHADNFGHGELNDPLLLGTNASLHLGQAPTLRFRGWSLR